ncbi:MAG TPA: M48 family metalloprotease [archaeon]|nr:M48 family metalloprotease [archaeon]
MRALITLLICCYFIPGQIFADYMSEAAAELKARFAGKTYYLRETYNSSSKIYCYSSGIKTYYMHRKSQLFPLRQKEQVVINDIESPPYAADYSLRVSFQHKHLGNGSIRIFNLGTSKEKILENFSKVFNFAFSESPEDGFTPFIGNKKSGILHFIGCNHLPESALQENFQSLENAGKQGYKKCSLCFMNTSRIPEYNLEMVMGQKVAAEVRYYYPLSENEELKRKVQQTGDHVLSNWPVSLRGYKYTFGVLESELLVSVACPGGNIFITTGFLNILESDKELEAVLAREIAHIERRHGLRQYKKAKSAAFWKGLAKYAIATTVVPKPKEAPPGLFTNLLSSISSMATQIVLAGYSREYEQEADFYAISYLQQQNQGQSINNVLLKLQYYSNIQGTAFEKIRVFARYPNIDLRINSVQNASVKKFPSDCIFIGYHKSGDVAAQIQFDSQSLVSNRLTVFANLLTTSALSKEQKIKSFKVISEGKEYELENQEDMVILPNEELGIAFQTPSARLLGQIEGIKLKFGEVTLWQKE